MRRASPGLYAITAGPAFRFDLSRSEDDPRRAGRLASAPLLAWPATIYVSFFRGTPLLVQLFVIFYGLPSIGIRCHLAAGGFDRLAL